jgi:hypothetical protein
MEPSEQLAAVVVEVVIVLAAQVAKEALAAQVVREVMQVVVVVMPQPLFLGVMAAMADKAATAAGEVEADKAATAATEVVALISEYAPPGQHQRICLALPIIHQVVAVVVLALGSVAQVQAVVLVDQEARAVLDATAVAAALLVASARLVAAVVLVHLDIAATMAARAQVAHFLAQIPTQR